MYAGAATHDFPGLDLVSAADNAGCVDLLNVDFDRRGAARVRDGFDNFTSSAAAARYSDISPHYESDGTKQLLAIRGTVLEALNTSGASVDTETALGLTGRATFVRFAAPTTELTYVFATTSTIPQPMGVQTADNRLVVAGTLTVAYSWNGTTFVDVTGSFSTGGPDRVLFSNPGAPTTFGANNYVDLHPGDGETLRALVSYRELLIAFKETKFFVFYGNTTDSAGAPIFNYRPVMAGGGCLNQNAAAVAPEGVYFCSRSGVYLTTGGPPVCVSNDIEPIFTGAVSSFFQSSALNQGQTKLVAMTYLNGRVYIAYPSGSATANDRMLVFDTRTNKWTLWNIPAAALATFRIGDAEELVFSYASGSNHIGRHSSAYTDDDGTAIVSRYRSGFSDLGSDEEKSVVQAELWGTGTVNYQLSKDFGSLDTATSVAMGTSPAIARGPAARRGGKAATLYGWQVGATSGQWALHRLVHRVQSKSLPGQKTP